jgi:hypothetical protein
MICDGSSEETGQLTEKEGFGSPVLKWDDSVARECLLPGVLFFYVIEEGVIVNKGFANSLEQLKELARAGK